VRRTTLRWRIVQWREAEQILPLLRLTAVQGEGSDLKKPYPHIAGDVQLNSEDLGLKFCSDSDEYALLSL